MPFTGQGEQIIGQPYDFESDDRLTTKAKELLRRNVIQFNDVRTNVLYYTILRIGYCVPYCGIEFSISCSKMS